MNPLPIVNRELRVIARRPSTYGLRLLAGLGLLAVWLVLNLGNRRMAPAQLSQTLFVGCVVAGLLVALLAGVFLTADCLSTEKRDGTLGLLFLTDLHGHDVVLGKLAASSVASAYALLAMIPVMGLSLLLGGVTAGEFGRQALLLLVTLFFSLSLGMLISALSREPPQALITSVLALLAFTGLAPLLALLLDEVRLIRFEDNPMNWFSPVYACVKGFDATVGRGRGLAPFFASLVTLASTSAAMLGLACLALPRTWQTRESTAQAVAAATEDIFAPVETDDQRRHALAQNPYRWLATRSNSSARLLRRSMTGLFLLWLFFFALAAGPNRQASDVGFGVALFGAYVLHLVFKCLAAVEATRQFSEERRRGLLETLLATPLGAGPIIKGQIAALRRRLLPLAALPALANAGLLFLLLSNVSHLPNMRDNAGKVLFLIYAGGLVILFVDTWALAWVGMEQALRRRRHHWATLAALGQIMLPPLATVFLFVFLAIGSNLGLRETTFAAFVIVWLGGSAILDAVAGGSAQRRLRMSFHALVAGEDKTACPGASGH